VVRHLPAVLSYRVSLSSTRRRTFAQYASGSARSITGAFFSPFAFLDAISAQSHDGINAYLVPRSSMRGGDPMFFFLSPFPGIQVTKTVAYAFCS